MPLTQEQRQLLAGVPAPPPTKLAMKVAQAKGEGKEFLQYADINRICDLPIIDPLTDQESDAFNRMHVLGDVFADGFRLFPEQAEAVAAYEQFGAVFGRVPVGKGKTLISLMVANHAYRQGLTKILLLIPSQVLSQLVQVDLGWARKKVGLAYPVYVLGRRELRIRMHMARSGKPGLYILPYSLLSTKDTHQNIEAIAPQLIICDEAHYLAHRKAARTRRLMAYIDKAKPRGVVLSGTITNRSILDYYHLIRWVLGQNNPLPNAAPLAFDWAAILDASSTANDRDTSGASPGPLRPLIRWARQNFPQELIGDNIPGFRKAFNLRMKTTPGVVSSDGTQIGTSLIISNLPVPEYERTQGWPELKRLLDQLEDMWLTPSGDPIDHAIHKWKWLIELSAGFYNELLWPTAEVYARRKRISDDQAADILERAQSYHEAGNEYLKALRTWLEHSNRPGLDTPLLVGSDMHAHGAKNVGDDLYGLWHTWRLRDFEGRPDRDERAVRVCSYKIDYAVRWAREREGRGAILWVHHQEVGRWLTEALRTAGLDPLFCPAGEAANQAIRAAGDPNAGGKGDRLVVASIDAHHEGKNLQAFADQFFVQWPRPAKRAEQAIGRTHREGQIADELVIHTNLTLEFDEVIFAATLNDALYIHQTTGPQKLIFAAYEPVPRIFPCEVLRQRGLDNRILTPEQRRLLAEKFGIGE